MTEVEIREAEEAQAAYRTAWIEANYIVAGWWTEERQIEESPVL